MLEVVWETEALIGWSDVGDWQLAGGAVELILQYQEDAPVAQPQSRTLEPGSRGATVRDLAPGRVYLFSLRARHLSGAAQTLGSLLRVLTRKGCSPVRVNLLRPSEGVPAQGHDLGRLTSDNTFRYRMCGMCVRKKGLSQPTVQGLNLVSEVQCGKICVHLLNYK